MCVLEVEQLTKIIGKRKILDNVTIKIQKGEIVGFVGPNGAGKSTFIKTVLGLYTPTSGIIKIDGIDIKKSFENAIRKVGAIIENPDMYNSLTGYKNLELFLLLNGIKNKNKIQEVANIVKLGNRIKDKVKTYSLGMKQRLGIAQAIIKEPKLLILDEPTNGLDPLGITELRSIIKKLNVEYGMTILISSHILSELENICDRVIMIDEGKIIEEITLKEIKENNITLEEEFLKKSSGTKKQIV